MSQCELHCVCADVQRHDEAIAPVPCCSISAHLSTAATWEWGGRTNRRSRSPPPQHLRFSAPSPVSSRFSVFAAFQLLPGVRTRFRLEAKWPLALFRKLLIAQHTPLPSAFGGHTCDGPRPDQRFCVCDGSCIRVACGTCSLFDDAFPSDSSPTSPSLFLFRPLLWLL